MSSPNPKTPNASASSPMRFDLPVSPNVDQSENFEQTRSDFPLPPTPVGRHHSSTNNADPFPPLLYENQLSDQTARGSHLGSQAQRTRATLMDDNRSAVSSPRHRRGDISSQNLNRVLSFEPSSQDVQMRSRSHAHQRSDAHPSSDAMPASTGDNDPALTTQLIWGTTVNIVESMNHFRDFILHYTNAHKLRAEQGEDAIIDELDEEPYYPRLLRNMRADETWSLNLNCENLKVYGPSSRKIYNQLIRYPQEIIPLMDHTFTEVFLDMFEDVEPEGRSITVRPFNTGRVVNMRQLDPSDIDQLVTVKGLAIRASPIVPDLKQGFYRCTVCDHTITVDIDRGRITEPTRCPREACRAQNSLKIVHNRGEFADKQICRLQETPDEIPDGQTPYTVSLWLYDDLVDAAKPGDRLEITGVYRGTPVRVNPRQRAVKSLFRTYLDVVHVKKQDKKRLAIDSDVRRDDEYGMEFKEDDTIADAKPEDEENIIQLSQSPDLYDQLSRSIAPSIFGMEDVKKGVLLQLFGGSNKFAQSGEGMPRIRGDINILMVGDPGVSKSQLLQYVHKIAPRGIYTSGKGSSAVGLTAYVTRDPDTRQLVLESGALVLSDGGICCIDEFDKMSESTRSVLHEVMEQQTVSVAKAGIITTLNARTSILACANPINSKFDERYTIVDNINLPPTLMSRFDLLYLVLDKPDERDDRRLAQHIVGLYLDDRSAISSTAFLPLEKFAKYVSYAKTKINPTISEEAGNKLIEFYVKLRSMGKIGNERTVTATTRQLESMIRLAEAHARMRLSRTVEEEDVEEANRLILSAMQTAAIDPSTGRIDLDLVTTGISARSRSLRTDKRKALKDMLQAMNKTSITRMEALTSFRKQSYEQISDQDFDSLIQELVDSQYLTKLMQGKTIVLKKIA